MTVIIITIVYLPIISVISFLLPAMITSFKKNIHSFLFTLPPPPTTTKSGGDADCKIQFHNQPISSGGGGLVSATRDPERPPNVVESSMLMKPNSPPSSSLPSASGVSNIGLADEIGGGEVNGLMSCTESLGFESSDEREIHNTNNNNHENGGGNYNEKKVNCNLMTRSRSRRGEWRKMRPFPPPLSSLNRNGEPNFFLRPVRKNGRLELTEVRIHRPQILHASRHDGRLTLHFIPDRQNLEEEDEEEEEEEEEEIEEQESQEQVIVEETEQVKEQSVSVDKEEEEEEKEEENGNGELRFGKEGVRRCHEMVNQQQQQQQHHHHLRMCGISIV